MKELLKADLADICAYYQTNDLDLGRSSFLITGATGFVGSWLTDALLNLNREFNLGITLTCLTRDAGKAQRLFASAQSNLTIVEADISNLQALPGNFTHIVHAATPTTAASRGGDLQGIHSASVSGANAILDLLATSDTPPVFLHTSSGAVYGKQSMSEERRSIATPMWQGPFTDSLEDRYAQAKIETEELVARADSLGKVVGINARLFAFMGPRLPLDQHYAIGNFISSGIKDGVIQIRGNGKSVRSYLYAAEMTSQLLFLLSQRLPGPFHVGSEVGRELLVWAELVAEVCGASIEVLDEALTATSRYVPEKEERIPHSAASQIDDREAIGRWRDWIEESAVQ